MGKSTISNPSCFEKAPWCYLINIYMIVTPSTIASINLLACSYLSGGPSTKTFLNPVFSISFFATCIFAPLSCCKSLIVSPPFPMINPTQSFGIGII